jgi:hypothetical protein
MLWTAIIYLSLKELTMLFQNHARRFKRMPHLQIFLNRNLSLQLHGALAAPSVLLQEPRHHGPAVALTHGLNRDFLNC